MDRAQDVGVWWVSSPFPGMLRAGRGSLGSPGCSGLAEGPWDPRDAQSQGGGTPSHRPAPFAHTRMGTLTVSHIHPQLYVYKCPREKKKEKKKDCEKPLLSSIPSIVNVIMSRECLEDSFAINIYTLCFWAVICKAELFDLV